MKEGGKYILGALGIPKKTGDSYQTTRYRLGERISEPTPLFMRALAEFFPDFHPVFLVTRRAEEAGWPLVEEVFGYSPEKIRVPDGKTESELWELVGEVVHQVKPGTQLILDVTHGFRSLPLFTLQVGILLKEMGTAEIAGVYYGAFEARDEEATPVFDLSPLIELNAWTQALATLAKLGQAGPLTERLDGVTVPVFTQRRPLPKPPAGLRGLSDVLKNLSDALHTLRTREVFELAKKLVRRLPEAEGELDYFLEFRALVPYLQPSFKRFAELAPAREGGFEGPAGVEALARMIRFYLETEAYVKAITVAREALVSLVALEAGEDHTQEAARKVAEEKLNRGMKGGAVSEALRPVVALWERLHDLRNDVNHAGFRKNPRRTSKLVEEAKKLGGEAAELILSRLA